jgi:hypothetical protein
MKYFLILFFIGFSTISIAQNDTLTKEYFGVYSSQLGDEDSGNEMNFYFGKDLKKNFIIYKEAFVSGNNFATYYKLISFDKKSGKLVVKSETNIISEDGEISVVKDSNEILELFFIKKGNGFIVRGDFHTLDFIKSEAISFEIMSEDGKRKVVKL